MLCSVPTTRLRTISPEIRASLPITILFLPDFEMTHFPNAAVYLTISAGVKPSPAIPPMVPLMPEIDFIKVKISNFKCCQN